jgi:hypothetical protein
MHPWSVGGGGAAELKMFLERIFPAHFGERRTISDA